ncbi:MAG: ProQ/FinO family protein [Pseudomonadota bacterium]
MTTRTIHADPKCIAAVHRLAEALGIKIQDMPPAFPKAVGDPVRPLKIGVREQVLALMTDAGTRRGSLRALRSYALSLSYLMSVSADGAVRVDLDGSEVEPVSPEHAARARGQIIERRERRERLANVRLREARPAPSSRGEVVVACAPTNADLRASLGL